MIDNSQNIYIPFHLKCGIIVHCNIEIFHTYPDILTTVEDDVRNCIKVLPPSVHDLIRRTRIWMNVSYVYGPLENPKVLKHTTTHHSEQWLICVNDVKEKALGIEIYNCEEYLHNREHWNGCGLLLHEYCHLIHQLVLSNGLDNDFVKSTYEIAMNSCKYENVLRRDWAYLSNNGSGNDGDKDRAYATINHKEFFAELSVAFLCCGYEYLEVIESSDQDMSMDVLSPPFQAREVMSRQDEQSHKNVMKRDRKSLLCHFQKLFWIYHYCIRKHSDQGHCNKFFPFTRTQLKAFDYETFLRMTKLWNEVKTWKDPNASEPCWIITVCNCFRTSRAGENELEERLISDNDIISIPTRQYQTNENYDEDTVEL